MSTSSVDIQPSASTSTEDIPSLMMLAAAAIELAEQQEKASAAEILLSMEENALKELKNNAPKNAKGRTPLPVAPSERRPQSPRPATMSKTATKCSAPSQTAFQPERVTGPEREAAPDYAAVSQNTPWAPSQEGTEPALKQAPNKMQCLCTKCMDSSMGQGKQQTKATWTEHSRAEKRHNEGRPAKIKCSRCTTINKPCMVDDTGASCAACTWVKEKCCREGAKSNRHRSGGDGTHPKKSPKLPVADAVVPKQAKRKASEPMEGPKKAQKLADGGRHTFTEDARAEPEESFFSSYTAKATDGENNMPVVGASHGSSQNGRKCGGWVVVN
ncbi:hypothetical protein GCG54_00014985 [Colletotrichum gloeosporioides]|uniref:Uncharacterized protein n=2 Tax=Colletotrichum gloeosporioides TaxID=474922 RepID=T0L4S6_COLGC|nr:uncharacterized protein GCG54_00014985 [Colletotrichum gloeosporioides]EQB43245.1 hypothetical protein CGLO_18114 [Colletotrichum gloeosporioides Cg-14]KAF3801767.1 hypothetical protein GCG54_00014985 [Colletotrichum gloeosporioides]